MDVVVVVVADGCQLLVPQVDPTNSKEKVQTAAASAPVHLHLLRLLLLLLLLLLHLFLVSICTLSSSKMLSSGWHEICFNYAFTFTCSTSPAVRFHSSCRLLHHLLLLLSVSFSFFCHDIGILCSSAANISETIKKKTFLYNFFIIFFFRICCFRWAFSIVLSAKFNMNFMLCSRNISIFNFWFSATRGRHLPLLWLCPWKMQEFGI